jgi:hypothetical protein
MTVRAQPPRLVSRSKRTRTINRLEDTLRHRGPSFSGTDRGRRALIACTPIETFRRCPLDHAMSIAFAKPLLIFLMGHVILLALVLFLAG